MELLKSWGCRNTHNTASAARLCSQTKLLLLLLMMMMMPTWCRIAWMPKVGLIPQRFELARFYKLHTLKDCCEPISMIIPRKVCPPWPITFSFTDTLYTHPSTQTDNIVWWRCKQALFMAGPRCRLSLALPSLVLLLFFFLVCLRLSEIVGPFQSFLTIRHYRHWESGTRRCDTLKENYCRATCICKEVGQRSADDNNSVFICCRHVVLSFLTIIQFSQCRIYADLCSPHIDNLYFYS